MTATTLPILLAGPRGFCAGVDRAIDIVEKALAVYGAPVYVRHQIVHNRYVVESLARKGAVFVSELDECPNDRPVIFSAHGVPKAVPQEAQRRNMIHVDATCPLVTKVHKEAERHYRHGSHIILVGHDGHPEVAGTMGQLPDGAVTLVETVEDVAELPDWSDRPLAFITQTTLSMDDTANIVRALKSRFPHISGPRKEDICYATTNRQEAVKAVAARADGLLVIGAPNSSNSNRLVEVAAGEGCHKAQLVERGHQIDPDWLADVTTLGITAGASAPEALVEEVIDAVAAHYPVTVEEVRVADEDVVFKMPRELADAAE